MLGKVIDFPKLVVACTDCPWARNCVAGLHGQSADGSSQRCPTPIKRNQHAFRQGDALEFLYVLRSGSAKSYFDNADGLEQIVAFHYPGDLLGFDAIANGFHQTSVCALETAALCRIPFASIDVLATRSCELGTEIIRAAARQMIEKNQHALQLGQKSAQARFAGLLVYLSERFAARGCSRVEFNLTMQRQDIANYLSLAVETVSRLFSDLQAAGVIMVERRYVRILSLERLRDIATDHAVVKAGTVSR